MHTLRGGLLTIIHEFVRDEESECVVIVVKTIYDFDERVTELNGPLWVGL